MCQLLGLSANAPVSAAFSLGGFFLRGGATDDHADGWGLGYYQGDACHLLTDARAAAHSPLASEVKAQAIRSRTLIAHVRKATQGPVHLDNCHPFRRQLWGRTWLFAHNGDLKGDWPLWPGPFQPVGATDSERAFCSLLNGLVDRFGTIQPDRDQVAAALRASSQAFSQHGPFNFLLSEGDALFAHCSTHLHFVQRKYPFTRAQLLDSDESIDFAAHNAAHDRIVVVATRPLTRDECWTQMQPGQLEVFVRGTLVVAALPLGHSNQHLNHHPNHHPNLYLNRYQALNPQQQDQPQSTLPAAVIA